MEDSVDEVSVKGLFLLNVLEEFVGEGGDGFELRGGAEDDSCIYNS